MGEKKSKLKTQIMEYTFIIYRKAFFDPSDNFNICILYEHIYTHWASQVAQW